MIATHERRSRTVAVPAVPSRRPAAPARDARRPANPVWQRLALASPGPGAEAPAQGAHSSAGPGVCPTCGRRGHGRCPGCGQSFETPGMSPAARIQRSPATGGAPAAASVAAPVARYLRRSAGTGAPLPHAARRTLERSYAADLGAVRVHADPAAGQAAAALHAEAFTLGDTIWFGHGRYRPDTPAGRRLLAHEVAHTVQQAGRYPGAQTRLALGAPDDAAEAAARRAADAALGGRQGDGLHSAAAAPVIRRQPLGEAEDLARGAELWSLMARGRLVISGFPLDEATLTAEHEADLDGHALTLLELLEEDPDGRVDVTGHTDATGTAARNETLGLERATVVRDRLVAAGVPAARISVSGAAARELVVDTAGPEPANRRSVVAFLPALRVPGGWRPSRPGFGLPPVGQPAAPPLGQPGAEPPRIPSPRDVDPCILVPELCEPGPRPPTAEEIFRPVPPPPRTHDGLRSFFERDPLLRLLPPWLRSRAIDGLMRADEAIAGAVVGQLDVDPTTRRAITEALRALLRYMKGERWTPPLAPPSRLPPGSESPGFPKFPGERIFTLPPLRF